MGIASFVLGLLGLFFFCVPCLGWILSLLGFIFGIVDAVKKGKRGESRGFAVAGIVLSTIAIVINIIIIGVSVLPAIAAGTYDIMSYY
ncbi:MAG: hypothetical protein Q4D02_06520 [Clostridia bacterium]|nr:hypothetical protein [Clostridia bacterium]